jgi:hypothetical protein
MSSHTEGKSGDQNRDLWPSPPPYCDGRLLARQHSQLFQSAADRAVLPNVRAEILTYLAQTQ